ncbi:MAG: prenyltransferase/squalene oxidase repeat-containing protein, partial [Planctomycetota bacterium]
MSRLTRAGLSLLGLALAQAAQPAPAPAQVIMAPLPERAAQPGSAKPSAVTPGAAKSDAAKSDDRPGRASPDSAGAGRLSAAAMPSAAELMTPARRSIDRGLAYLAGTQQADGSLGRGYGRNVAVVGLAGMAMLASGSTPGRGPYGENIDRCVDYLIQSTQPSGFITADGATSQGPMYGHGFATLLLAEAYGMSPREELRDKLSAAVKLIVSSQNDEGGWRYQPRPNDADISVTICQIMALRAARNAGLHVPNETVDRCVAYVRRCQNPDGGFGYMPRDATSLFPRSAAGVVALFSAGVYEGDEVTRGLAYVERQRPGGPARGRRAEDSGAAALAREI